MVEAKMQRAWPALAKGIVLILSCLQLSSCDKGPNPTSSQVIVDTVILVSIDSLRADHLGAYGYAAETSPFIDELAKDGLVFERAYSTSSWTLPAHAAMFSGLDDYAHGVLTPRQRLAEEIETLPEQLAERGIRSTGFFAGPFLHPSYGLGQGFEEYIDCTSYGWRGVEEQSLAPLKLSHADVTNPILLERVGEWLSRPMTAARNFIFIHMWDVHFDYIAPRSYVDLFDADYRGAMNGMGIESNGKLVKGLPERDHRHLTALYDAEIRYTDDTLRELLRLFQERGLLERAAVIVVADHGEELLDHGHWGHARTLYEEVLRVPFILSLRETPPVRASSDAIVSIVDLYPTVCELFGADCDYRGSGTSVLPLYLESGAHSSRGEVLAELTSSLHRRDLTALVGQDGKLIRSNKDGVFLLENHSGDGGPIPVRRIRRTADGEYPAKVRERALRMDERVEASRRLGNLLRGSDETPAPRLDEATHEHLRALGYVE